MSGEGWYLAATSAGIVLATFAAWRARPKADPVPRPLRRKVHVAAVVGGVFGAYVLELPADVFGWSTPAAEGFWVLGGRTVLGGVLGGWAAVEWVKHRAGFSGATGDRFAVPLSLALACGRVGCVLRGCCEGVVISASGPLAQVSLVLHHEPRFPAALLEGWFHGLASVVLAVAARFAWGRGVLLAGYLSIFALVRFALEFYRAHPTIGLGMTYYQWLAATLFGLAAWTWWRRS